MKRTITWVLCLCLMLSCFPWQVRATEQEYEIETTQPAEPEGPLVNYAYINIRTMFDDRERWDALVLENETILLRVEDIAAMLDMELTKTADGWIFTRGYYCVEINLSDESAEIYLKKGDVYNYLYGTTFDMPEVVLGHPMGDFLGMDKMFYLTLTQRTMIDDMILLEPHRENFWDVMPDIQDMLDDLPLIAEVTDGNSYKEAAKHTFFVVTSEIDLRIFDISGRASATKYMEEALVSMMSPSYALVDVAVPTGEDLPDPDKPVITTNLFLGMSRFIFLRLCSLAPFIIIFFCDIDTSVKSYF